MTRRFKENRQEEIKKIKIPLNFQGILWSADVKNLNLEKDKTYITHQVLMYGTLEQIKWLFKACGKGTVKKVFLEEPKKIYRPAMFHFIRNFIILKNQENMTQ